MLSENFELHFGVNEIDSESRASLEERPDVQTVLDEFRSLDISVEDIEIKSYGYGYGADGYAIGIVLSSLVALFLSGKRIEENLDAWVRLGKRFKQAIQQLHRREISIAVSEPGALAMAISHVSEDAGGQVTVQVLSNTVIRLRNSSISADAYNTFLEHPDRYYIFVLQVGDSRTHVLGMSARGSILFNNVLSLNYWAYETFR